MADLPELPKELTPGQVEKLRQVRKPNREPPKELPGFFSQLPPDQQQDYLAKGTLPGLDVPGEGARLFLKSLPYVGATAATLAVPEGLPWYWALAAGGGAAGAGGGLGKAAELVGLKGLGDEEAPKSGGEFAKEVGKEAGTQALTEVGGRVAFKPLEYALGRYFDKMRLYRSGLKLPPSLGAEKSAAIAETGIREGIPLTEAGAEKAGGKIKALNSQIENVITSTPSDIPAPVYVKNIQTRLDDLRKQARLDVDRGPELVEVIDDIERKFLINHGNVKPLQVLVRDKAGNVVRDKAGNPVYNLLKPEDMNLATLRARARPLSTIRAQEIKKATYENIRRERLGMGQMSRVPGWDTGTHPGIALEARQELTRALREEIGNRYPGLNALNARDGALMDLEDALDRFLAREGNKQILPYFGGLASLGELVTGHTEGAAAFAAGTLTLKALENPAVKSYLAIALDRASRMPGAGLVRRGARALPGAGVRYFQYFGEDQGGGDQEPITTITPEDLSGLGPSAPATAPKATPAPTAGAAPRPQAGLPAPIQQMLDRKAAGRVPAALVKAVAQGESAGDAAAVGPEIQSGPSKGQHAQGLMQLVPSVQKQYGVADPLDAEQSAEGGIRLLQDLMRTYQGKIPLVLAAYYWGSDNLDSYRRAHPGRALPKGIQTYVNNGLKRMGYRTSTWDTSGSLAGQ